jgi:hypothetical protein
MHEILRISREFYGVCSTLGNFGKTYLAIVLSLIVSCLAIMTYFMVTGIKDKNFTFMIIGMAFEIMALSLVEMARDRHNINTITKINDKIGKTFTKDDLNIAKFEYIKSLVINVSEDIHVATEKIDRIIVLNRKNMISDVGFGLIRKMLHFIYSSESKNRIISLVIYVFSLLAIIFVVKNKNEQEIIDTIFSQLSSVDFAIITVVVSLSAIISLIIFVGFLHMVHDVIISKILLFFGYEDYLIKDFMGNLCQYSFYDPANFPNNCNGHKSLMEKLRFDRVLKFLMRPKK